MKLFALSVKLWAENISEIDQVVFKKDIIIYNTFLILLNEFLEICLKT